MTKIDSKWIIKIHNKIIIWSFILLIKTASYLLIDFISKHYKLELSKYFCTNKILLLYFHIYVEVLCKIIWGGEESFISNPLQNNHKPKLENSLGLYSFLMVTFSSNNKSNINNDKI